MNQRVLKANLWIINYCTLEMKSENEPAISLPVYFKSVKKWKYVLRRKKTKQKKQKDLPHPPPKNKQNKILPRRESNPGPPTSKVNALPIAPPQPALCKMGLTDLRDSSARV